jgi:hypothetical protein
MRNAKSLSRIRRVLAMLNLRKVQWYFRLRLNLHDVEAVLRPARNLTRQPTRQ